MQIDKIYIDMDGVLSDFDGWKATIPGLTEQNLWEHVAKVDHFFSHLKLMPEATLLMEYLRGLDIPLAILTALPRRSTVPTGAEDKHKWIVQHFGDMEFHAAKSAVYKQQWAGPGLVLIDDSELNIPQWKAQGGIGIRYTGFMPCYDRMERLLRESE
jgi:5'(3')-deoxyribonucleotidase